MGELFIPLKISWHHDELRTELSRADCRHWGVNAELARLVRSRRDDPALLATNCDRLSAQLGISRLLDRGEEGVGVEVDDCTRQNHWSSFFCSANQGPKNTLDH